MIMSDLQSVFMQKTEDFLGVRLTKQEKNLIKKQAEKENMTYSNLVRKIIVEYFIDQEEKCTNKNK
jgi:predicted DNA binding CopG/RHH family protein